MELIWDQAVLSANTTDWLGVVLLRRVGGSLPWLAQHRYRALAGREARSTYRVLVVVTR